MPASPNLSFRRCDAARWLRLSCLVAAMSVMAAAAVSGQVIRGTVVDSTMRVPVNSGFVVLVGADGRELTRVLADREGRFTLRAPGPGTYRVRSERIGYQVTESPALIVGATETLDYALQVLALPVRLGDIAVRADSRCRVRPEEGLEVAIVWEEARKALAAATWTAGQRSYRYDLSLYQRATDGQTRQVTSERAWSQSGLRRLPFASAQPAHLSATGYVVEQRDGTFTYHAPDAAVLLHPTFLDTHCFSVTQGEGSRAGLVAVAFRPVDNRDVTDVTGRLWLDKRSNHLVSLEYSYTRLPHGIIDDRIGGTIVFMPVESGPWVVREWHIRMPTIGLERTTSGAERYRPVLMGFEETGGEVTSIKTGRGEPVYAAELSVVSGTVYDSTQLRPLGGAVVTLAGTDYEATTDAAGNFAMVGPFDGRYQLTFSHPRIEAMGVRPPGTSLTIETGEHENVALIVPSMESILADICPAGLEEGQQIVHGRVLHPQSGRGVPGARVHITFRTTWRFGREIESDDTQATAVTDADGSYSICRVPQDHTVVIYAESGDAVSHILSMAFVADGARIAGEVFETQQIIWNQDFQLNPPERRTGSVSGIVTTVEGMPAADVEVEVVGTPYAGRTDSDGRFVVSGLPRGSLQLSAHALGYEPARRDVLLREGESLDLPHGDLVLSPASTQLAPITVEAEASGLNNAKLAGFEVRRKSGRGHFYTRFDIEAWNVKQTTEAMRRMSGVRVLGGGGGYAVVQSSQQRGGTCKMVYFVDGRYFGNFVDDPIDVNVPADQIEAVEVYSNAAQLPAEFSRFDTRCGAVVFWTRI